MLALVVSLGCSDEAGDSAASAPAEGQAAATLEIPDTPETPSAVETVDDSAEGAIRSVMEGLSSGNAGVVWSAMPEGYQKDVTELVQGFGNGVDPGLWQQITGVIGQFESLLSNKADFIVNSTAVQDSGQAEQIKVALPGVASILKTLLSSIQLDALKSFDGDAFFSGPASQLLAQADLLSTMAPGGASLNSLKGSKVETVSEEGDKATLRITNPQNPSESEEVQFVRVDGQWLPADLVNGWATNMAMAKQLLAGLPEASKQAAMQVGMFTGMITGTLAPLEAAEDQEQFNLALEQAQQGIMGLAGMMGGGLSFGAEEEPPVDLSPGASSSIEESLSEESSVEEAVPVGAE
jgi:hypothetical protein